VGSGLGAAAEVERVRVIGEGENERAPPDALQAGAAGRVGHRWHWFGLELGAMAFSGWRDAEDVTPSFFPFPQLELAFGPESAESLFLGVGGATVTTMRQPALGYIGFSRQMGGTHELSVSGGLYRTGPALFDTVGPRSDLVWRTRVAPWLDLRVGCSVRSGLDDDLDGEGSFGLRFHL
jgi:hypothetical protein